MRASWRRTTMPGAAVAVALVLAGLLADAAPGAPRAEAWELWRTHRPESREVIDHSAWDELLSRYVVPGSDGIHRVRYAEVGPADRRSLAGYLERLQAAPVRSLRREEQRAFWINLYNALTVKVVLDHYPVESIRDIDISPGLFSVGPWKRKLVTVEGEELSLDDVEHRILRPLWNDPRIHYAVNCASLGCPNLAREAYTAENTERLLEAGARAYVNHPRGARFEDGRLVVSSIYVWFEEDFDVDGGVLSHLRRYARPQLAERLAGVDRVSDDDYDWSLNDAAHQGARLIASARLRSP